MFGSRRHRSTSGSSSWLCNGVRPSAEVIRQRLRSRLSRKLWLSVLLMMGFLCYYYGLVACGKDNRNSNAADDVPRKNNFATAIKGELFNESQDVAAMTQFVTEKTTLLRKHANEAAKKTEKGVEYRPEIEKAYKAYEALVLLTGVMFLRKATHIMFSRFLLTVGAGMLFLFSLSLADGQLEAFFRTFRLMSPESFNTLCDLRDYMKIYVRKTFEFIMEQGESLGLTVHDKDSDAKANGGD